MLNEKLFRQLERAFGEGKVKVANPGQEMDREYVQADFNWRGKQDTRYRLVKQSSGEEYRLDCPYCNDKRKRLTINYRWGRLDPRTGTRNLWLAQCWNEQCLSDYALRKKLWLRVSGKTLRLDEEDELSEPDDSDGGESTDVARAVIRAPGPSWPLEDLLRRMPHHPAIRYLQDRFFDPAYLSRQFKVGFILESEHRLAINRLYAPIIQGGKLIGWQCRRISDENDGSPKWWSCPGMAKGTFFYNFDAAMRYQTKVIVEGPPDVWGYGRQAMGLLGKSISDEQVGILNECVGADDVVAVMLDPDQSVTEKGKQHHIEKAVKKLERQSNLKGKVIPIYLPAGRDPGDMDRYYMRQLIANVAHSYGLRASFRQVT